MLVHGDGYGSNNDGKERWMAMWMAAQCSSSSRSNSNDNNGINDENGSSVEGCN